MQLRTITIHSLKAIHLNGPPKVENGLLKECGYSHGDGKPEK
jgi:hypothetical protein